LAFKAGVSAAMVAAGLVTARPVMLGSAAAAAPSCIAAGDTGLSAAMVVTTSVSNISLAANGCDVGMYVPPGTSGITISNVTVTGANDHGIFVQDASDITISDSTVTGNGLAPTPGINENKAIELVGTANSTVTGNTVTGNLADGGIGIADDGPIDPGAPKPGTLSPAVDDTVSHNESSGNFSGCGVVYAAYNPGAGISGGTISDNTVQGSPGQFGPHGPVIGGVVVAADTPATSVSGVSVEGNTVTGAAIPGVIVHSNAPHDSVSNVTVTGNTLSLDDWLSTDGPPAPTAILVAASPIPPPVGPTLSDTTIASNTISNEFYGIWTAGASATTVGSNTISTSAGGRAVFDVPPAGSGYWEAASDGEVFSFGDAGFYGSMGSQHLNAPVVGLAPSLDQGGYWLAGADGGVFSFGDAGFYGSMGGQHLNAPVVAIAPTPVAPAPPGGNSQPAGKGYWLAAADGGVFSFGDAAFYGSMGDQHLNAPVVAIAPTPDGHGYWLAAADGGVFSFGDAAFYGSMGDQHLNAPIVSITPTPDGHGYWLAAADGGVFSFGDAGFYGSMGGQHLNAPVVASSAVRVTASA
jgi:parallel beta-helix repeat protein